ncbi:MAG: selenocysteine-specific translation elongation factor [Candidatus Thorarchaeota archaeon]
MEQLIPVHVGLLGHIDHGKTELARALSEKVSTAGLDSHPQAKSRGITIDLGFSMFVLDKYLVTLVDAPGHADLITSVVSGTNIIDAAILTVAANEGPMVQTGEHIVVLRSMGIDNVIVAITKVDLVDTEALTKVIESTKSVLSDSGVSTDYFIPVSATTGQGIELLKDALAAILEPRQRDVEGSLLMPIDHAFPIKGHGTVVTGTILRGQVSVGDTIQMMPQGTMAKIRSLQTFGDERRTAKAGDRVGANIPDLDDKNISRGNYVCAPNSMAKTTGIIARIRINPLYRGKVTSKMVLNATVGMPNVTSEIIPFEAKNDARIIVSNIENDEFDAAILLKRSTGTELGFRLLLMRTDLPPTTMRIVGAGEIAELPTEIRLFKKKVRVGRVSRIREADVLVEGLAFKKENTDSLKGASIKTRNGVKGMIEQPFGTRGVVSATFDKPVEEGEDVIYERLGKEEVYRFGQ